MYYENSDGISIHSGFPNPATDSAIQGISLHRLLVHNSTATYFMRVEGNEWQTSGVQANDIIIIDRSLSPQRNDLVIWWRDGAFAISACHKLPKASELWGVVTAIIHQVRGSA